MGILQKLERMTWTPLMRICVSKDTEDSVELHKLEKYRSQINASSSAKTTNLHFVALGENIQLAKWLIENGAEFNLNDESQSALHWACKSGYLPMVELILENIPQSLITILDADGTSALDWAREYENVAVEKLLLKKIIFLQTTQAYIQVHKSFGMFFISFD